MSQITKLTFEEELKKNRKLRESDVQSLREWCQKEPHLPKICDNTLAVFLHSNNYHIELTKVHIDHYYSLRTHMPEFYSNRDILKCPDLRHILGVVCVIPLKQLTKEGHNILFIKFIDSDASKFHFQDFAKLVLMNLDLWTYLSGSLNGYVIVYDVGEISLGHATRVNPLTTKKYIFYQQDASPIKLKGTHFLNVTHGREAILKASRPLMNKNSLKTLHVHHSMKTLEKFVPIDALPNELGGKAGPLMELHEAQIMQLEKHQSWFLEEELRSQVDETKRPGKEKSADHFFGVEGSFKKLDDE